MRRRFLPLAAAFSMMAAAADEQQPAEARESLPAPSGELFDGDEPSLHGRAAAASEPVSPDRESPQAA
jgi:hypothetical protein